MKQGGGAGLTLDNPAFTGESRPSLGSHRLAPVADRYCAFARSDEFSDGAIDLVGLNELVTFQAAQFPLPQNEWGLAVKLGRTGP